MKVVEIQSLRVVVVELFGGRKLSAMCEDMGPPLKTLA